MSNKAKNSISDAAQIIEKFGGIRPMSAKINVAVTTIQGWKKRDTIPGNRKAALFRAATEHKIDLSSFFEDAPHVLSDASSISSADASDSVKAQTSENQDQHHAVVADDGNAAQEQRTEELLVQDNNHKAQNEVSDCDDEAVIVIETSTSHENPNKDVKSDDQSGGASHDAKSHNDTKADSLYAQKPDSIDSSIKSQRDFTQIAVTTERRAITKSSLIAAAMVILVVGAIVATLWPEYEEYDARGLRLSDLEVEVSDIKKKQSSFKGLVSQDWIKELNDMKQQVEGVKNAVNSRVNETVRAVQDVSNGLTDDRALEKRVVQLQSYVSEISSGNTISSLMGRYDSMRSSINGQEILAYSSDALGRVFDRVQATDKSDAQINEELDTARQSNPALAKTFENVPKTELKAAAMLFALTQVRSSFNRGDKDFEGDLQLLKNMVGEDDEELRQAIDKISPHARSGLLSGYGLKEELQTVAGDVVASSLRGEDVSFGEKMSARMNDILKVEKNGEMVSGSDTQKTVDKAQKLVEKNQLQEALTLLKSHLNDEELRPLRPWLSKAEAVMASRSFQQAIERAIELNTGTGYLGGEQLLKESFE